MWQIYRTKPKTRFVKEIMYTTALIWNFTITLLN